MISSLNRYVVWWYSTIASPSADASGVGVEVKVEDGAADGVYVADDEGEGPNGEADWAGVGVAAGAAPQEENKTARSVNAAERWRKAGRFCGKKCLRGSAPVPLPALPAAGGEGCALREGIRKKAGGRNIRGLYLKRIRTSEFFRRNSRRGAGRTVHGGKQRAESFAF